jgi:hypothetical protein
MDKRSALKLRPNVSRIALSRARDSHYCDVGTVLRVTPRGGLLVRFDVLSHDGFDQPQKPFELWVPYHRVEPGWVF